ncbi:hypothetical protein [Butyrivibrio sp. AE3004]|uniref:hypothetical protein n=1 Tax=Butyrivibrio sp. AE3004 TaxID=1506994 RepID=UPI0004948703|nr:hypothetical protein [Butyrivibrio sp. AE3004]
MIKRRIVLLKKLTSVIMICSLALSSGCASSTKAGGSGDAPGAVESTNSEISTESKEADAGKGTAEEDTANASASSDSASSNNAEDSEATDSESLSEEDLSSPIDFTYQNHPMTLMNNETRYASGNYYTVQLEKSDLEKYPKLQKKLDELNESGEKMLNDLFTSNTDEINEMFSQGCQLAYEFDHNLYPVRADGKVFSFVIENYTYLAGAHGYADYSNYNFDPSTGQEIAFSEVVKNTEDLPEIVADEIIKQNDDLKDYFTQCPTDRQNLIDSFPDRLANNARGLAWTIDYDGMRINFEDYAMGSYAAGARDVKIRFADYPDLFTDTYNNYRDAEIPDVKAVAKELKDAEDVEVAASPSENLSDTEEEDYGEDWWYHTIVENPGWEEWTADGIDTTQGTPSFELSEISSNTTDWLNEDEWSKKNNIPLPDSFPYNDGTYTYSVTNDPEGGTLSLTVMNDETQTLCGNFYFDDFIAAPDGGEGLFADFTQPYIHYALMKDDILYVSLGHRTYASANPHKSYIVAIDTVSGKTLWRSADQVCGSCNFIIRDDSIICGYGFTAEPDYIYILNRHNGKIQKKTKVKSAPSYFIPMDDNLYVLTYNTEYLYKIK